MAEQADTTAAGSDGRGPTLRELLLSGEAACQRLPTLSAASDDYRRALTDGLASLDECAAALQQLDLFSKNELYSEHSAQTLRMLLVPAYRAEMTARRYPDRDDPERDPKRVATLERALELYREFLQQCCELGLEFAAHEHIKFYLDLQPGTKRDRDAKIAHMRSLKQSEVTHAVGDASVSLVPSWSLRLLPAVARTPSNCRFSNLLLGTTTAALFDLCARARRIMTLAACLAPHPLRPVSAARVRPWSGRSLPHG